MGSGPDGADGAQRRSCSVAVVGAGAAGLAAARELLREGHAPVVFEQGRATGGVWVYDDAVDADSLGSACPKDRVHSSMYQVNRCSVKWCWCWYWCCLYAWPVCQATKNGRGPLNRRRDRRPPRPLCLRLQGLRTNLPREVMSFTAFPFTPEAIAAAGGASSDTRRFPSHGEVLSYLRAYAQHYGLARHVRFNTRVVHATPVWGPAGAGAVEGAPLAADACGEERPVTAGCGLRWRLTLEVLGANGNAEQHQHEQVRRLVRAWSVWGSRVLHERAGCCWGHAGKQTQHLATHTLAGRSLTPWWFATATTRPPTCRKWRAPTCFLAHSCTPTTTGERPHASGM